MEYGLVGAHLPHSYSKLVHESLERYTYELLELDSQAFQQFIVNRQYKGLNITIPYKKDVLPLCDQVSDLAREIGAANTLYFAQSSLCCTNTDYHGFLYAVKRAGIEMKDKKVLVLGNGGTSLTVQKAALDQGASHVTVASRNPDSTQVPYDHLPLDSQVIINTTPVGMYPNNGQSLISLDQFPSCCGVIDVIYNPLKTNLLLDAAERNIPCSNGIPMLVAQATAAAGLFLKQDFEDENLRIIRELERDIENIVLIGMPGCGKSTLGQKAAKTLGKSFVDLDREIERTAGKSIPAIFSENGEDYFRDLETRVAIAAGKEKSQLIATGGGCVLRPENMKALRQNGRTVFLQRDLAHLATADRPLSKDLTAMYETRLPLYNKYSDLTLQVRENISSDVKALIGGLY